MQHLGELTSKLKEQVSSESREMEQAVQSVFHDLSENLRRYAATELNTIKDDMDKQLQKLRKRQFAISVYHWKQNLLANFLSALLLVIVSVSITGFYGWRIKANHEELKGITTQIASQKKNVSKITAWKISAHQIENQKYLVFPKGMNLEITQTESGKPALLLKR